MLIRVRIEEDQPLRLIEHGHHNQKDHAGKGGGGSVTAGADVVVERAHASGTLDAYKTIHEVALGLDEPASVADALGIDSVSQQDIEVASATIKGESQRALIRDGFPESFEVYRKGDVGADAVVSVSTEPVGTFAGATRYRVSRSSVLTYGEGIQHGTYAESELHVRSTDLTLTEAELEEHLGGKHDQKTHAPGGGGSPGGKYGGSKPDDLEEDWIKTAHAPALEETIRRIVQSELAEHLPGKHDQKSHGKGGGASETGTTRGQLPDHPHEARVRAAEGLIAMDTHQEHLFVFDQDGDIVAEADGDGTSVTFDSATVSAGDLHLHNHPTDRPFSPPDVENAFTLEAGEIRTVGMMTRARMLPPQGQDYFSPADLPAFQTAFTNAVYRNNIGWGSEPSATQADAVWRDVAGQMGLRYSYEPR